MSKIAFSEKLKDILRKIGPNKMSKLPKLEGNFDFNFLDITDSNDLISFTPIKKIQDFEKERSKFFILNEERRLTNSDKNDKIFLELGYDKIKNENVEFYSGQKGIIVSEAVSELTGKTYVLFQECREDNPRQSVYNKRYLVNINEWEGTNQEHWNLSRNNIKIGRLIRHLFKSYNIEFTEKEIEEFVNKYKATYDFIMDLGQFEVVSGKDLVHFYQSKNYVPGNGTLNGSCMANVSESFLDIYSKNEDKIKLIILYGDDGIVKDGKYICKQIKGRALIWDLMLDGKPIKFVDRIYTVKDSDTELFKKYAEKNNWWYKESQTMRPETNITNGKDTIINPNLHVQLSYVEHSRYPYVDTLCYVDENYGLHNTNNTKCSRYLKCTNGLFEVIYHENSDRSNDVELVNEEPHPQIQVVQGNPVMYRENTTINVTINDDTPF